MTPEKFGAIGDGKTDDTAAIKEAAKHTSETGELFTDTGGKTYLVSEPITFHNRANVDLFDSVIKGSVIVSKKHPGTMRLRVKDVGVEVKRLPSASDALFRVEDCVCGVKLAGDIEACNLGVQASGCIAAVMVAVGDNKQTLDECSVKITAHNNQTVLIIRSEDRQVTGSFDIHAEQVHNNAIDISGSCRVTLSGLLRSICKNRDTSGLLAREQGGRPHITLNNLSMIGSRIPGTQPFFLNGIREIGGTSQVTNF